MLPVPAAYLRVYEPLASVDGGEPLASLNADTRRAWADYVDDEARATAESAPRALVGRAGPSQSRVPATPVAQAEADALAATLIRPELVTDIDIERAFVTVLDGELYVCPWRSGLRAWEGLVAFRSMLPDPVAEAYCPENVAERVEAELAAFKRLHPEVRSHVLSSPWTVPIRWFACFEPVERMVVLQPVDERALWYRSPMRRVRRRITRALSVVRASFGAGGPTAEIEALDAWLDQFHPSSLVELEYGGLTALLDDEALRSDESAADVLDALDGLAMADAERAGAAYERVVERWRDLALLERSS